MRKIKRIIVHCTATPDRVACPIETVRKWHVEDRGWSDVGYHFLCQPSGLIERGRAIDVIGAHVSGHNRDSIGIALAGGRNSSPDDDPLDHYEERQLKAAKKLIRALMLVLPNGEEFTVHGHNEFANKACPGFQVGKWIGNE